MRRVERIAAKNPVKLIEKVNRFFEAGEYSKVTDRTYIRDGSDYIALIEVMDYNVKLRFHKSKEASDAQICKEEPISLKEVERRHIEGTLKYTGGNKASAARLLGITASTLYNKLKAYKAKDEYDLKDSHIL